MFRGYMQVPKKISYRPYESSINFQTIVRVSDVKPSRLIPSRLTSKYRYLKFFVPYSLKMFDNFLILKAMEEENYVYF